MTITMNQPTTESTRCPICGAAAERGCVYGSDKRLLQWIAGDASWKKNILTGIGLGLGEPIGQYGPLTGPYLVGVRCSACRRITLEYESTTG